MSGLPKRTGLKMDPEDAELYRKYHDQTLSALRSGFTAEQICTELVSHGVPERTAARIVIAVQQEVTLAGGPKASKPHRPFRLFSWVALLFLIGAGSYVAWQAGKENHLKWGQAIPIAVVAIVVSRAIYRLLRKQDDAS